MNQGFLDLKASKLVSTRPLLSTSTLTVAVATVSVYAFTLTVAIETVSVNVDTNRQVFSEVFFSKCGHFMA